MWFKIIFLCIFGLNQSVSTHYPPSDMTTSFDVGGIVSGNSMGGVPLGHSLGSGELDVEGVCSEPGQTCQNCTHAVTCVMLPLGYLKVPLQVCPEGQTCNAHKGGCSNEPVAECDGGGKEFQHTCEQVGIFPDAYDCKKFHLCSPPEGWPDGRPADHRTALCPRNYMYDPSIAQCSIKLNKGQCAEKPVPDCKEIGQMGVLPRSPNHYYVCVVKDGILYPQVFICPHGWYFWNGSCRTKPAVNREPSKLPVVDETIFSGGTDKYQIPEANPNIHDDPDLSPSFNQANKEQTLDYNPNRYETDAKPFKSHSETPDEQNTFENSDTKEGNYPSTNHLLEGSIDQIHQGPLFNDNIPSDDIIPASKDNDDMYQNNNFQNNYNVMLDGDRNIEFSEHNFEQNKPHDNREDGGEYPESTTTRIERFVFSTVRSVTNHPDNFLADKFDFSNYETTDDVAPPSNDQDGDYFDNTEFSV